VVLALLVITDLVAVLFVGSELLRRSGFRLGRHHADGPYTRAQHAVRLLQGACIDFCMDVGRFPAALDELVAGPGIGQWDGPYLERAQDLTDPWGRPYLYRPAAEPDRRPDVFSLGKDGRLGGTGSDRDIHATDAAR